MIRSALFACLALAFPVMAEQAFHPDRLEAIDRAIAQAVTDARTPGAVFRLERNGSVYQKAYGERSIVPTREKMSEDTVFDAASLTKVVATTTAVMLLMEEGRFSPDDPVSKHLPEFRGEDREKVTIRHLLTHSSGLRAGLPPQGDWKGKQAALNLACKEKPTASPGTQYRYSDINFILLGFLVERLSGRTFDDFCSARIFRPLGMTDTGFRPFDPTGPLPLSDDPRIAPTQQLPDGTVLRGVVHDPTARRMGGVAGHAGLFITMEDLATFSRMLLDGGISGETRLLREETVKRMTSVQSPAGLPRRGFGWDIDSPYAGPRGEIFPIGSFGHTGWTGTRLWLDPFSKTSVLFLSNRNHPDGKGDVVRLQRTLGTLSAEAITGFNFHHVPGSLAAESVINRPEAATVSEEQPTLSGIDVLKRDGFRQLRGRKIGLVTNHTGIDRERNATIDLLYNAPELELIALFSPEHGIRGDLDQDRIGDSRDDKTGLPVHSLYGERRTPTPDQLRGIDTLVFDIQDIGCRFYTYISTMVNSMEAASAAGLRFIVLDRPNPIGPSVEGPVLAAERSFIATHEIPPRHGMTVGELAHLIAAERKWNLVPEVIRCEGGSPLRWFDRMGQPWRNPSPNMRNPNAAALYPGIGLLEFCRVSVGRGTDTPFEVLGAPYGDDLGLAAELNAMDLPGVRFLPVRFTPTSSVFSGEECRGVRMILTNRDALRSVELGVVLATIFHRRYPDDFGLDRMAPLLGHPATLDAIRSGKPLDEIQALWVAGLREFESRRQPYLLYPR